MSTMLTRQQLAERLNVSVATLSRWQRSNPDFPPPVRIGGPNAKPLWPESVLEDLARAARPVR